MKPIRFKHMNSVYTAEGCDDLPTLKDDSGTLLTVTSVWRPSEEDLAILNAGGSVCLTVVGGQPPVALWAQQVEELEEMIPG